MDIKKLTKESLITLILNQETQIKTIEENLDTFNDFQKKIGNIELSKKRIDMCLNILYPVEDVYSPNQIDSDILIISNNIIRDELIKIQNQQSTE